MANPIQRTAQLQPVANPVDTFVQPARSPLRDVAESLGGFADSLRGLMEVRAQKEADDDKVRGQAWAATQSPEQFATAVRTGKLPASASPNFMAAANQAQGALAGGNLQQKWNVAFQEWEGKNEEDPTGEKYNAFFQDFLKANFTDQQDPQFLRGTLPYIRQLQDNGRAQYIAYRDQQVQTQSLNSHVGVATNFIRQTVQAGDTTPEGTNMASISQSIAAERQRYVQSGGDPLKFDTAMMESMSGLVLETGDEDLLGWFSEKNASGLSPDQTPDGLRIKNATRNQLENAAAEAQTKQAALEEKQRKASLDQARSGIMQFVLQNRGAAVPEELLAQAEKNGDWEIRTKIAKMRDDLNAGDSDPASLQAVATEIINNPNTDPMQIVRKAMERGVFKSYDDVTKAANFAQSFKDNGDKINRVTSRQSYQTAMKVIADRTTELNDLGSPISGLSDSSLAAQYDFQQLMTRWLIDNPNATDSEIEKRINEVQTSILGDIKEDPNALSEEGKRPAGVYERDPELANFPNASAESIVPLEEDLPEEPVTPDAGTAPQGNEPTPEQIDKYINALPADQRGAIEETLKRKGTLDLQGYTKSLLTANPNLRPISYNPDDDPSSGLNDSRPRSFTPEEGEGFITQAVLGSDAMGAQAGTGTAENLLNLIGNVEAQGNYNAVFSDAGQQTIDLGQFSVDDILARQQWAKDNGYKSTAIGKYQVIYDTLRSLKAEGVVDGSEAFDKATQDRIGMALLNRRGLNEFLNGSISKRQFALRLSQEWAALPNPSTGKSYYAGDGLNASRVPPSTVYSAMGLTATPVSYGAEGDDMGLRFVHPEQRAGMKRELTTAIAGAYQDLGIQNPTVLSGHRDHNHPVERGKPNGGGEHTTGGAGDVSLKGLDDAQRARLVNSLILRGVKRFITYDNHPDMLHIDLKDQRGDGSPYFMHNKSARNLAKAPQWFRDLAYGSSSI